MKHSQIHSTWPLATLILLLKPNTVVEKKEKKRKLQADIFNRNICKNRQQNISKSNSTIYKENNTL